MSDRVESYARAFLEIAKAEGHVGEVEDELFRFARVLDGNDELLNKLADPHITVTVRQQIVEDLLGGKAQPATVGLISLAVGNDRVRELPAIPRAPHDRPLDAVVTEKGVRHFASAGSQA